MSEHTKQTTSSLNAKSQAWSGRFNEPVAELVKRYTASVDFDKRLAEFDIQGSIAHAQMLAAQQIISADDLTAIEKGLAEIKQDIQAGKFEWLLDLEDVHLNIEKALTDKIGDAGKRLHTGRSRNDQVATDIRLYLRAVCDDAIVAIKKLQMSLLDLAEQHADTIMPGFTHLQVAQPVTFGHHLLAYYEMLNRDSSRFADCRKRMNQLPLGAAALAGTSYLIDREMVATLLGFEGICQNSLDAVSDRDFAIEFTACGALVMTHLSRLSEELILWSSPRFAFVEIADRFCTGSSIMPQKKNPDVPELVRGKTGRVNGHLVALLTLMKGQPLAYNKDNMRQAAFEGYATATDLADYLVKKGMPFRDAHEVVALAVKQAVQKRCDLSELSLSELQIFSPTITEDVFSVLTLEGSVASRNHVGGTSPQQVLQAIVKAKKTIHS